MDTTTSIPEPQRSTCWIHTACCIDRQSNRPDYTAYPAFEAYASLYRTVETPMSCVKRVHPVQLRYSTVRASTSEYRPERCDIRPDWQASICPQQHSAQKVLDTKSHDPDHQQGPDSRLAKLCERFVARPDMPARSRAPPLRFAARGPLDWLPGSNSRSAPAR